MKTCCSSVAERLIVAVIALMVAAETLAAQPMRTIPRPTPAPILTEGRALILEVIINDFSTGMLVEFAEDPVLGLTTTAEDLAAAGLKSAEAARGRDGRFALSRLPGVSYQLDEITQKLYVLAPDEARVLRRLDARHQRQNAHPGPRADYGAVLNYSLFGATGALSDMDFGRLDTFSGSFDLRTFGPYGTISHSFVAGRSSHDWMDDVVRLRTAWAYSDPLRMITYRAGDLISGGLSWTRPVNLGGVQVQRNFDLRGDLVTKPLPSFAGSAAVPSTLEVYAQNTRVWSSKIAPGPFEAINLPVIGVSGDAQVVLRDSQGRETVVSLPFYNADILLREGLLDFSFEAGFPRRSIGVLSDDYDDDPFAILSARYGFSNRLTLEGHIEAGPELVNGGMGAAFLLGRYGTMSLSGSGSTHGDRTGAQAGAAVTLRWGNWSLYGRTQRTFGDYDDVASVSARKAWEGQYGDIVRTSVPRAIDQLSLGIPVPLERAHLRAAYTRVARDHEDDSEILSLNYSQEIWRRTSFRASVFHNLRGEQNTSFYAGLSIALDNGISASAGYDHRSDGSRVTLDAAKSEKPDVGSYGWRARVLEGDDPIRSLSGSYRSSVGRWEATVTQYGDDFRGTASADGALLYAGGGLFATPRIHDAFAVVDVGAPDVEVRYQNRPVGVTDRWGRVVVPNLRAYQSNTISIDPANLPVDADIPTTREVIVPAGGAGVVVNFGVTQDVQAALVGFVDANGAPIKAGATVRLEGVTDEFIVGYDGEAFVRHLAARNVATIEHPSGTTCRAEFGYEANRGMQVRIDQVICQ